MLTHLAISDVVLIERLAVPFQAGLTTLTGETGAGKSILLDALALALGARGDVGLIRAGAKAASVTASFEGGLPASLTLLLEANGLAADEPLILRRTLAKDGKSRAFINDQPASIALLRQIGELLLEVHGQFETHGLLNAGTHRALLDAFAGLEGEAAALAKLYAHWQSALRRASEAEAERNRARDEEAFLAAAVAELDSLDPQEGEIDRLAERRLTLQNREKVLGALGACASQLDGERGASGSLAQAGKALARIAGKTSGVEALLAIVDRAAADLQEASEQLARLMAGIEADGTSLEAIEERLFKLRAIARKHGVLPEKLRELHADLQNRLSLLADQGAQGVALAKEVLQTRAAYKKEAEALGAARIKAAAALSRAVCDELPPLKLGQARFTALCEPLEESAWGPDGIERVVFQAATNPGASEGPLHKIASGGELARFMLALKVVLAKADPVPTLVFDEVDAGIGGSTASAVGERLARVAQDVQILVVTHSPQVAARAQNHLHVAKTVKGGQTETRIAPLNASERLEEIARMLAGSQVTAAARTAAQSLLDDAQEQSAPQGKKVSAKGKSPTKGKKG